MISCFYEQSTLESPTKKSQNLSTCTPSIEPTREWSECTSALQVAVTDINSQVRPHCPSAYYVRKWPSGFDRARCVGGGGDRPTAADLLNESGPTDRKIPKEGAICATCPTSAGNEHRLQQAARLFLRGGRQPAEVRDPSAAPRPSSVVC